MMAADEERVSLQIILRKASGPQVLHLCHRLSALFGGQAVEITTPSIDHPPGVLLLVHCPSHEVQRCWPKVRTILRASGLLEPAVVELHSPTADESARLWPPPGHNS